MPDSASSPRPEDSERASSAFAPAIIAIAFGLVVASIFQAEPLSSANDRSRWATVRSLLAGDGYQINFVTGEPHWDSIDKVLKDGTLYSSKPPLLSTLVAGVTWVFDRGFGWDLVEQPERVTRWTLLVVNGLPFLLGLIVFNGLLRRHAKSERTRLLLLLAAGFASYLPIYAVTLNNHLPAAIAVLFAISALMGLIRLDVRRVKSADSDGEPTRKPSDPSRTRLFLQLGFFSALAVTMELPAGLFAVATGLYALRSSWKRTFLLYLPAAAIPLAGFFYTNYLATGGLMPFYVGYGTELYEYELFGVPSYWTDPSGLDRNLDSPLTYLLHCTIGHHGIFSLTPLFLLLPLAWLAVPLWNRTGWRTVTVMSVVLTLGTLGFYLTRTENYNYGGLTAGLRWTFWLIPLWWVSLIPLLDGWGTGWLLRKFVPLLLGLSVASVWSSWGEPWRSPWLFDRMTEWEWIDYSDPPLKQPDPAPRSWITSLPDPDKNTQTIWAEYEGRDAFGAQMLLRLEADTRRIENAGTETARLVQPFRFRLTRDGEPYTSGDGLIDVERFEAGAAPEAFLIGDGFGYDQLTLLGGHPDPLPYRVTEIVYLPTPLRDDAYRTELLTSISVEETESGRRFLYRTRVWASEELPFGTGELEFSVRSMATGEGWTQMRYALTNTGTITIPKSREE